MSTSLPQSEPESPIPPSERTPDSPSEIRNRKIVAIISMILGAGLLALMVLPPVANAVHEPPGLGAAIFIVVMLPLLSIPGILCLWFGYQLFQRRTEESLRLIVGTTTFLLIGGIGFSIAEWLEPLFSNPGWEGSGLLLLAIATAIIYPLAISRLLPVIGGERKSPRIFISKGMLTLVAFLVFFSLSTFLQAYVSLWADRDFTGLPLLDGMIQLVIAFSPMIIPYVGYRLAVQYFFGEEA